MNSCPHTGRPLISSELSDDSFLLSENTGAVYYAKAHSASYNDSYFTDEYKNQYGKTYLEDEINLRRLAKIRLDRIEKYIKPPAFIFEIGCAVGFFLDEARLRGYRTGGMEISEFAANHASKTLHLDVIRGSFAESPLPVIQKHFKTPFDVIASFYTLEHFPDQKTVFENISELLKPNGILAAALPSTNGPLFHFKPDLWIKTHPADHFADYSPRSLKKILPLYGLELLRAYPASYHPERIYPFMIRPPFAQMYRLFALAAGYGDTMEIIAGKK